MLSKENQQLQEKYVLILSNIVEKDSIMEILDKMTNKI